MMRIAFVLLVSAATAHAQVSDERKDIQAGITGAFAASLSRCVNFYADNVNLSEDDRKDKLRACAKRVLKARKLILDLYGED